MASIVYNSCNLKALRSSAANRDHLKEMIGAIRSVSMMYSIAAAVVNDETIKPKCPNTMDANGNTLDIDQCPELQESLRMHCNALYHFFMNMSSEERKGSKGLVLSWWDSYLFCAMRFFVWKLDNEAAPQPHGRFGARNGTDPGSSTATAACTATAASAGAAASAATTTTTVVKRTDFFVSTGYESDFLDYPRRCN